MKNVILLARKHKRLLTGKIIPAVAFILLSIGTVGAQPRMTPLDISDLSFTPSVIDTTESAQSVFVTIRVTNIITDVKRVKVGFRSLTGNHFVFVWMDGQNLVSGTDRDGIYRAAAIFPRYIKAGRWMIFEVAAFDTFNYRNFYGDELAARGFTGELQVISADEDTAPPELIDFSFIPAAFNADGSQNVTVTVRAADQKAGVRFVDLHLTRPNYDGAYPFSFNERDRISGDEKDGIYKKTIRISADTASSNYEVNVHLSDAFLNSKAYYQRELLARGFPIQTPVGGAEPAAVSISGRVTNANGRGVSKAIIAITAANGKTRYTVSNPFGFYRFDNLAAGATYSIEAKHKSHSFAPRVLFVDNAVSDLNFTGISEN